MSKDNSDYKDELDCEVTVFEGAHNTCDQTEGDAPPKKTDEKAPAPREELIKDNYNI